LKANETTHSTIKVSPTFKWPTLGDDGPDSKEVEETSMKTFVVSRMMAEA
jgi:hypothetical protein